MSIDEILDNNNYITMKNSKTEKLKALNLDVMDSEVLKQHVINPSTKINPSYKAPTKPPTMPLKSSKPRFGSKPYNPWDKPVYLNSNILTIPDGIFIDTITWNTLIPQNATYKGGSGGGPSVYIQPFGPITINYTFYKGLRRLSNEAVLVTYTVYS